MRLIKGLALVGVVLALGAAAQAAPKSAKAALSGPLVIAKQGSFFVGGRDVTSDSISFASAFGTSGVITVDQIYVRYQTPVGAGRTPKVVLIHGCCLTGMTWETTPDGRMGWDEYFVRRGYPTYVIDQSWRGRSAADPSMINAAHQGKVAIDKIPQVASSGHETSWVNFRIGPAMGKTYPGVQYPTEAAAEFFKQMVPDEANSLPTPNPTVPNLALLSQKLEHTVLISHSQSGIYPFQVEQISTQGIVGIVSIEPGACPDAKGDLAPYASVPTLVVFGDFVDLNERWKTRLVTCREFVARLNAAGGHAQMLVLPEAGIMGNTHMMMQDKNNLQVADALIAWIRKNVKA